MKIKNYNHTLVRHHADYWIWTIWLLTSMATAWMYLNLPTRMAIHWGLHGEVNGFMPKFWGAWLIPFLMLLVVVGLKWLPKIDPLVSNVKKMSAVYFRFILGIEIFLAYLQTMILSWNLGYVFDIGQAIMPALGGLFYLIGDILPASRQNWFLGIRTPWTLSNKNVWEKTHRLGGRLFRWLGLVVLIITFTPSLSFYVLIFGVLSVSLGLIWYSYSIYR